MVTVVPLVEDQASCIDELRILLYKLCDAEIIRIYFSTLL